MGELNAGYPELLGTARPEDTEPGEAEGTDGAGGSAAEDAGGDGFARRWGWLHHVDRASETMRCSWDDIFNKPAIEFLNVLCYRRDLDAAKKAEIDRYKLTH